MWHETEFNDSDVRLEDEAGFGEAYTEYKGYGFSGNDEKAKRMSVLDCKALGLDYTLAYDYVKPEQAQPARDVSAELAEMRELYASMAEMIQGLAPKPTKQLKEVQKKRSRKGVSTEELEYVLSLRDNGVSYSDIADAVYIRFSVKRNSQAIRTYISRYLAS